MPNVTAYANPIVLARSCGGVSRCIIVRKRTITTPLPMPPTTESGPAIQRSGAMPKPPQPSASSPRPVR